MFIFFYLRINRREFEVNVPLMKIFRESKISFEIFYEIFSHFLKHKFQAFRKIYMLGRYTRNLI